MPTDKTDLERRVALITPEHLVRGFNFAAVLGLVEKHLGADAAQELRAPVGKRLLGFFNYSAADYLRTLYRAADLLEDPLGGVDPAFRAMGSAVARALLSTTVGKTLLNFVRGGSVQDMLRYVNTGYSMGLSFGSHNVASVSGNTAVMRYTGDPLPLPYHEGIMLAGLAAVDVRADVSGVVLGPDSVELTVRWR